MLDDSVPPKALPPPYMIYTEGLVELAMPAVYASCWNGSESLLQQTREQATSLTTRSPAAHEQGRTIGMRRPQYSHSPQPRMKSNQMKQGSLLPCPPQGFHSPESS